MQGLDNKFAISGIGIKLVRQKTGNPLEMINNLVLFSKSHLGIPVVFIFSTIFEHVFHRF